MGRSVVALARAVAACAALALAGACSPPLAQPGMAGGACLDASMRCNTGLHCEAEFCVRCGSSDSPCCMGLRCDQGFACRYNDAGSTCVACGGMGQSCCADGLCSEGLACDNGRCTACGGATQVCCTGGRCTGTFTCQMGGVDDNHCF